MIQGKKNLLGLFLITVLTAATGAALLQGQSASLLADCLRRLKPQFLLAGSALMLGYIGCEAACTHRILKTLGHGAPFSHCLGYSFVGFYVSSITPSATGGQPAQVYYMSRDQIPAACGALNMTLIAACYQIASIVWGGAVWMLLPSVREMPDGGFRLLLLCGAGMMLLLTLGCGMVMFLPKMARRICGQILKLLTALCLVRNPQALREKLERHLSEYAEGAAIVRRHPGLAVQVQLLCVVQLGMLFSVPWTVYLAFGMSGHSWSQIAGLQALLTLAVCNLPLPGAVGAAEGCFLNAFAQVFGESMVTSAMLVSRGISFYAFLLLSLVIAAAVHLRTRRQSRRQTRGQALREMTGSRPGTRVQAAGNYLKAAAIVLFAASSPAAHGVTFAGAALLLSGYGYLQKDTWYMQPYINSVPRIGTADNRIEYDGQTGVYTVTAGAGNFKILQITDIHLGGSLLSYAKDIRALKAVYALIRHTRPDLVIVTGDMTFPVGLFSFSLNNYAPASQFAAFMRNVGVPWAFAYGNHDTESTATHSPAELDEVYRSLSYKTSGTLLYPYIQPEITGRNNQLIEIRNGDGSLNQALFLLDSNAYADGKRKGYDYIRDDQVDWYAEEVIRLREREGRAVSSMAFFHIPLQQYRTAYELYEQGSGQVRYFFGENREKVPGRVCCSDSPGRLFEAMLELGSTKAVFCGHDHYNNMSLEYQGIRLTYGMSIDYLAMPGIAADTRQRGATLITLHADSSFTIEQVPLLSVRS